MYFTSGVNSFATGVGVEGDWDTLLRYITEKRHVVRPATKWHKEHQTPWVAPFILGDLGHRRKTNIIGCSAWTGFDLDHPGWTLTRLDRLLNGVRRVIYTTTKSTPLHQRWRILVALDRPHTIAEHEAIWRWFQEEMEGELDANTKDVTRLLYCPARWAGADNAFATYMGEPLPVDDIIKVAPPPPPDPSADYHCDPASPAPDGIAIITEAMIVRALCKPEGGRLYGLMVGAAVRFRREGWALTATQLADAARQASRRISPGKSRRGLLQEAENALAYATTHVQSMTALEKFRGRMAFQLSNSRKGI